jgi:YHS domain-containing protein
MMTLFLKKDQFIDPVCHMVVDPAKAPAKYCHNGVEIYFCAQGCKAVFEANPDKYMSKKKSFWQRYLDRLNRATGGQPPECH